MRDQPDASYTLKVKHDDRMLRRNIFSSCPEWASLGTPLMSFGGHTAIRRSLSVSQSILAIPVSVTHRTFCEGMWKFIVLISHI